MGTFTAALQGFEDRTNAKLDLIVRYIILEIRTRLIIRSPVDTGRFRNNWQMGVEAPPLGTFEEVDRTGQQAAARIAAVLPYKAAGLTYYIVNNLPYGQALEDGGSNQAPQGMVKLTLMEADQITARAVAAAG